MPVAPNTLVFMWGALAMASLTVCFLFTKFWRHTGERLFGLFAGAFFVFAVNWTILGVFQVSDESRHYAYIIRLIAYALILLAILEKNRD